MTTREAKQRSDPDRRRPLRPAAVALVAIAVAGLCIALYPAPLPTPPEAGYVDNIFDNRVIVWIARLTLVLTALVLAVAGAFAVASAVVRMRHGHWLRRVGPFEISERAVARAARPDGDAAGLHQDIYEELTDLRVQLALSSEALERAVGNRSD